MSQPNKPDPRGFKPGANMPQGDYDPKTQGMSESGNHAAGHPGNDNPHNNQQSASSAAKTATHRDRTAGARGDVGTDNNRSGRG